MITAGIDLAAQAKRTALCYVDWSRARPRVDQVEVDRTDEKILAAITDPRVAVAGVDVPFGWPDAFKRLLRGELDGSWATASESLRLRATDRYVRDHVGMMPLSVSASMLAAPAMRFQLLRAKASHAKVREVYPAAALEVWKVKHRGYKAKSKRGLEPHLASAVFESLREQLDLEVTGNDERAFLRGTDAVDALVAALVARAIALGKVVPVPDELQDVITREGWIELPTGTVQDLLVRRSAVRGESVSLPLESAKSRGPISGFRTVSRTAVGRLRLGFSCSDVCGLRIEQRGSPLREPDTMLGP